MSRRNTLSAPRTLFLSALTLGFTLLAYLPSAAFADCDHTGAYIVNLSQDAVDKLNPNICTSKFIHADIRECIAGQIDAALDEDCETDFDVYVPGTAAEHGAWKQFNHMFAADNNRAHLVLQYQDDRDADTIVNFDPAAYDQGVIDARLSLNLLLDALEAYFPDESIRVFGHSKGSHAVALVAELPQFDDIQFFAFAQPGRTGVDISSGSTINAAELGTPGFIEKLSPNLVGITWENDEVYDYIGDGFNAGSKLPERWGFPGFIWQDDQETLGLAPFRIDHHNNYGGLYTDGLAGNDWRDGEGSVADNYPYCATGDKEAMDEPECEKQNVDYVPYFWGTPECQAEAFRIMNTPGDVGRYYIGYSGPREPRSCKQSRSLILADWDIRTRFNLGDKHCRYYLRVAFVDQVTGEEIDHFEFSETENNDNTWRTYSGSVEVPHHVQLEVRAWLDWIPNSDIITPSCDSVFESEIFIEYLTLTFTHPAIGESNDKRTIIGYKEGRGSDLSFPISDLHLWDNVAWQQPNRGSEELKMYYSAPSNAVKIEGPTKDNNEGNFRKRVHLLD
jgi:hypothetical protein